MEEKREVIYSSSQEALSKLLVLMLTFGISILASLIDNKGCYITVLVQAINNMYDFYKFTDNRLYGLILHRESIIAIVSAIFAIIVSVIGIIEIYQITNSIWMKLLTILLVTIPLIFVYNDYKMNRNQENKKE